MRSLSLRFATLELTDVGAVTVFPDGATWAVQPDEAAAYREMTHRLGYEGDTLRFCREHELAHHVVAEGFGSHSWVLWAKAHGEEITPVVWAAEEGLVMHLLRYARTGQHPCVSGADWDWLLTRFLTLADGDGG